jgi:hypothetical protein
MRTMMTGGLAVKPRALCRSHQHETVAPQGIPPLHRHIPKVGIIDVDPVGRHPECDKAIALGSQVLLFGGASGIPDE